MVVIPERHMDIEMQALTVKEIKLFRWKEDLECLNKQSLTMNYAAIWIFWKKDNFYRKCKCKDICKWEKL